MRTTTAHSTDVAIRAIQSQRDALERTQAQVSTGRRVVAPGDDPVSAADGERARAQLARIEMERRAATFAANALGQADGALTDATDVLQTTRETLVAAGNGGYSAAERALLAEQLDQSRKQLFAIANRPDGSGGYVFGGMGGARPFVDGTAPASPVQYAPVAGQLQVGLDQAASISLDGQAAFTAQPGRSGVQNVFSVLDNAIAALRDPTLTGAGITASVSAAIDGVDGGIEALQLKRTQAGEQARAIEAHTQRLDGTELHTRTYLADVIDVDLAEALSRLADQQNMLDAAMKTYTQVSQMSLFKYV